MCKVVPAGVDFILQGGNGVTHRRLILLVVTMEEATLIAMTYAS
jgi:hypothetical protein